MLTVRFEENDGRVMRAANSWKGHTAVAFISATVTRLQIIMGAFPCLYVRGVFFVFFGVFHSPGARGQIWWLMMIRPTESFWCTLINNTHINTDH